MTPAARERRFRRIKEIGCLACRACGWFSTCEIHHLNLCGQAGRVRRGDEATIGLCAHHHRGTWLPASLKGKLGPSLALSSKAFRRRFGTDDELLAKQDRLIAEAEKTARGVCAA
ncbi:MAG: Ref family recombination enhancement nuclease [Terriglobia bacterium]